MRCVIFVICIDYIFGDIANLQPLHKELSAYERNLSFLKGNGFIEQDCYMIIVSQIKYESFILGTSYPVNLQ